jgi:ubiquinone/menaquinone biosynthesis C-methylase UbiE
MKRVFLLFLFAGGAVAESPRDPAAEGPVIVGEAFGRLSGALAEAISKGGPQGALPVCSEQAPAIAKEVGARHGVTLRRATLRARNPKNRASDAEKAILEAFSAALGKKETPQPRVVEHADGSRSFYAPIILQNALCLQCHGIPGRDVAPATVEAIRKLYPEDAATGYSLGELRGLWHVAFPAKTPTDESSVKPGINEKFLDPDLKVGEWTRKFETESREIYHLRDKIVVAAGIKPGITVADIGAGTGLFTLPFSEAVGADGRVYAVEIAKNFLEHIRARAAKVNAANVRTILCNERSVELPEASVDLAFICDVYHHFEYPKSTLSTLHRAIKPGGELVLIDFKRIPGESSDFIMNHVRAGQEVFESEIAAAGFEKTAEVSDLLKENYFVRFSRR